jgi:hypothetical protein
MMWRVHLSNRPLQRIDLPGPAVVAAWPGPQQVYFFDRSTGVQFGERTLRPPDRNNQERWQEFVGGLVVPTGAYLPYVRAGNTSIYISADGRMRLYHDGGADLALDIDGNTVSLDAGDAGEFVALDMDRFLGLVGALDERGRLHIFQQHIRVGTFDLGLKPQPDLRPAVAIAYGGGSIFVTDGECLLLLDAGGEIQGRLRPHYFIGRMACSPNGRLLVTGDIDTNVIRGYSGGDLTATHQRHAIDLMADATQLQLLADMPPTSAALAGLAAANDGTLAFALGGVLCIATIANMNALPRPQRLL